MERGRKEGRKEGRKDKPEKRAKQVLERGVVVCQGANGYSNFQARFRWYISLG